ncbi:MAG: sulfite exporter TauE/SafE family protein [Hyphomicrobiales bacterium]
MFLGMSYEALALLAVSLLIAGAATGFFAGVFGVGGGIIIVPVLYELFRILGVAEEVRMPLAVGSSLAIIVPTSIRSFRAHLEKGAVDKELLKAWAVPVILGVIGGSLIARVAPPAVFKSLFAGIAAFTSFRLLLAKDNWVLKSEMPRGFWLKAYGLLIGLLSSLMGIGGGQLCNVYMMLYRRPIHQAVATSSGLGVLISIPGALGYVYAGWPKMDLLPPFSLGFVSLIGVALFIPTSMLVVPYGVKLAHRLPKRKLEIAFGFFLLIVVLRFLWTTLA